MDENQRFKLVFSKLHAMLEAKPQKEPTKFKIEIRPPLEVYPEELDQINNLRRIILESTEPEPISFTTA